MRKYISDIIPFEEIDKWKGGDNILIDAGTGAGKSYFILKKLLSISKKQGKKLLLLVPRKIIREQFEEEVADDISSGYIKIETYQWLESKLKQEEEVDLDYDYIVSDEAHYFLRDSGFNMGIKLSLDTIMKTSSVKIFLSATIKTFIELLTLLKQETNYFYSIEKDYSYIDEVLLFGGSSSDKEEFIRKKLNKIIADGEKAIVFINDIKGLKRLHNEYKEYSSIVYSNINSKTALDDIRYIVQRKKLPKQILFTTSVLEMGVTIYERKLKHIFTDGFSADVITQMIGRKREIDSHDKLNVYIRDYNNNQLAGLKRNKADLVNYLQELLSNGVDNFCAPKDKGILEYLIKQNTISLVPQDNMMVKLEINELYFVSMANEMKAIEFSLEDEDGFLGYVRNVFPFDVERVEVLNWRESINSVLESYLGRQLFEHHERKSLAHELDFKAHRRLLTSLKSINGVLQSNNFKYIVVAKRTWERNITLKNGERVENKDYGRTYWEVIEGSTCYD